MKNNTESSTLIPQRIQSYIVIPDLKGYEFIPFKELMHCEGWQKYTKFHLASGKTFVSSYCLGTFKQRLLDQGFVITHKSHVVNPEFIKRYLKEGILSMVDGSVVPVSRRKREDFINQFLIS